MEDKENIFIQDDTLYNNPTQTIPKPETNIGVDTKDTVFRNIADEGESSVVLNLSDIESLTQVSQQRDSIYLLMDNMCEDPIISSILKAHVQDSTEYNEQGRIVWCESSDKNVNEMVTFLLDNINVDKQIYKWVYCLCKYGDVYVRLYRQSDIEKDELFDNDDDRKPLNEEVKAIVYSKNDKYTHYVEMEPNPAQMFELTKYGKTYAYIKTDTLTSSVQNDNRLNAYVQYTASKGDVEIYGATDFVHASLQEGFTRSPEKLKLFMDKTIYNPKTQQQETLSYEYTVRRGKSILQDSYKIWRELSLLEGAIILNRLTRSSTIQVVGVEVADMPKEQVGPHLQKVKRLFEQKTKLNVGNVMNEYTNPGPVDNYIYVPTRNNVGALTINSVGGNDTNVGQLTDLNYFNDALFGSFNIPKAYFGKTSDGAGFNGGTSLAIQSSQYAKRIKFIQVVVIQMVTDIINLMLIDKGLDSYVNKFTLRMQSPTTQEQIDRQENQSSKIRIVSDVMSQLTEVENVTIKLKILKSLLAGTVTDNEVITLIQQQIDELEQANKEETPTEKTTTEETETMDSFPSDTKLDLGADIGFGDELEDTDTEIESEEETAADIQEESIQTESLITEAEDSLPTPESLDIGDLSNNNNDNI